jgi:hypothetical protein
MSEASIAALLGGVTVHTVDNRSWTPDELADRALEKIISVGQNSHPAIIEQALAFKGSIRFVLLDYLKQAQRYERERLGVILAAQGQEAAAHIIRSM